MRSHLALNPLIPAPLIRIANADDALNFMMADCSLPLDDRVAVRKFFRKSRRLFKRRSYVGLIDTCLSPELKDDVRYAISESLFQSVWYLKLCDREFLEELAAYIQRLAYSPKEKIDAERHLNVLTVGMATRGTVMIQAGMAFGDIILSSRALIDTTPALTMICAPRNPRTHPLRMCYASPARGRVLP